MKKLIITTLFFTMCFINSTMSISDIGGTPPTPPKNGGGPIHMGNLNTL